MTREFKIIITIFLLFFFSNQLSAFAKSLNNEIDVNRAKKMGIDDLNKKYLLNEIITGDSIFCATGITNGDIVSGIKVEENNYISETLITHKSTNLKKIIKSKNEIDE